MYEGVTLAINCISGTKNVGDALDIRVTIYNNGQMDLPVGTFIVVAITGDKGHSSECTFTTTSPVLVGGTHTVDCQLSSIPSDWSGETFYATTDVWKDNTMTELLAHAMCDGLLAISGLEITNFVVDGGGPYPITKRPGDTITCEFDLTNSGSFSLVVDVLCKFRHQSGYPTYQTERIAFRIVPGWTEHITLTDTVEAGWSLGLYNASAHVRNNETLEDYVSEIIDGAISVVMAEEYGDLICDTNPQGARVWLDGSDTGYDTPVTIALVPTGMHTIKFTLSGYYDCVKTVNVIPGPNHVSCDMTPAVGRIYGYVYNQALNLVTNAKVTLEITGQVVYTDSSGFYQIVDPPFSGSSQMNAECHGYVDVEDVTYDQGQQVQVSFIIPAMFTEC